MSDVLEPEETPSSIDEPPEHAHEDPDDDTEVESRESKPDDFGVEDLEPRVSSEEE